MMSMLVPMGHHQGPLVSVTTPAGITALLS
jgi:hypothetical protein